MKKRVNTPGSKRAEKKQIDIKWNSPLFFQIGLVVSLLIVFFIMQADFEITQHTVGQSITKTIEEPPMIAYVLEVEKPKPAMSKKSTAVKQRQVRKVVKTNFFDVKPNDTQVQETPIAATDTPVIDTPAPGPETSETPLEPAETRSVLNVEHVPVFPGCEPFATNAEKMDCMSSKINAFINKNFRKEVLENLSPNETYKIYVKFKIDADGYIADVAANSHNAQLKKEAQRVINTLPPMKPGKQGNKPVGVIYTVPIVFNIQ